MGEYLEFIYCLTPKRCVDQSRTFPCSPTNARPRDEHLIRSAQLQEGSTKWARHSRCHHPPQPPPVVYVLIGSFCSPLTRSGSAATCKLPPTLSEFGQYLPVALRASWPEDYRLTHRAPPVTVAESSLVGDWVGHSGKFPGNLRSEFSREFSGPDAL